MTEVIVLGTSAVGWAVLTATTLSFLGLGVQLPQAESTCDCSPISTRTVPATTSNSSCESPWTYASPVEAPGSNSPTYTSMWRSGGGVSRNLRVPAAVSMLGRSSRRRTDIGGSVSSSNRSASVTPRPAEIRRSVLMLALVVPRSSWLRKLELLPDMLRQRGQRQMPARAQQPDPLPELGAVILIAELQVVEHGRRPISGVHLVDLLTRAGHLCVMMLQIVEGALRAP